jgi:hypothetical protein
LKLFQELGEGVIKEIGGVNLSIIYLLYYKNLCKCHNVPLCRTTIKNKIKITI